VTSRGTGLSLALVLAVAAAACGARSHDTGSDPEPARCAPPLVVPDGFEVTGGIDDPQPHSVGVRLDLADDAGRELHFFSGMKGEFGEGLPAAGEVELRDGGSARLAGSNTTWVAQWTTPEPCTPTVVLGTGMDRDAFVALLRAAQALPADPTATPSPT
jgi:hypothetical protein